MALCLWPTGAYCRSAGVTSVVLARLGEVAGVYLTSATLLEPSVLQVGPPFQVRLVLQPQSLHSGVYGSVA